MNIRVQNMEYRDVFEHFPQTDNEKDSNNKFEWPTSAASNYTPIYRNLRCGKLLRKIMLSEIKQIIGEIALYLDRKDIVLAFDCEIFYVKNQVQVELYFISAQDTIISAAAVSGENIEVVLQYYINRGMIRLMVAKCGVFWIQEKIRQTNNPG